MADPARRPRQVTFATVLTEPTCFGFVLGGIVSLPLLAVLLSLWARGWSPTGDDAVIALRSFDVFTGHGPLLGHVNQASADIAVYDPGPLQNWLLAVPVRLFPSGIGAVLGATIVEVAALVAALVAVVRTAGTGQPRSPLLGRGETAIRLTATAAPLVRHLCVGSGAGCPAGVLSEKHRNGLPGSVNLGTNLPSWTCTMAEHGGFHLSVCAMVQSIGGRTPSAV